VSLGKLYSDFDSRCRSYNKRVLEIVQGNYSSWEFRYLTEVLLSDVWQSWCRFCRLLYLSSCRGCIARDGSSIPAINEDHSWRRLGYIARQKIRNSGVTPNGHLNFEMRKEPTWGDLDVFLKIIQGVPLANKNTLLSSFGSFSSLKSMQLVRNACAHKNVETINNLNSLSTSYSFSKLGFATDVVWSNCNSNGVFAIDVWIYEMNLIADLATATP